LKGTIPYPREISSDFSIPSDIFPGFLYRTPLKWRWEHSATSSLFPGKLSGPRSIFSGSDLRDFRRFSPKLKRSLSLCTCIRLRGPVLTWFLLDHAWACSPRGFFPRLTRARLFFPYWRGFSEIQRCASFPFLRYPIDSFPAIVSVEMMDLLSGGSLNNLVSLLMNIKAGGFH